MKVALDMKEVAMGQGQSACVNAWIKRDLSSQFGSVLKDEIPAEMIRLLCAKGDPAG